MRKSFYALFFVLLLAGCNLPTRLQGVPTPTEDAIGTQVSQMLTNVPTFTPSPLPATPTLPSTQQDVATETPTLEAATPTTAPPPTNAAPTSTVPASDPKSALGEPAWRDTLETSRSFYQYENEGTRVSSEPGALLLTGRTANGWMGWSLTYSKPMQNFYLEATMIPQTCSGADMYGLVFRAADNDSGYFYAFTCDGRFSLDARNFKDGTDLELIDSTPNSAILSGSNTANRIGVMVNGDRISLYANGVLLQEINDTAFSKEGNFGALVAANATPDFTVKLDEIAIWQLPGY
jgi:hypothetical protein